MLMWWCAASHTSRLLDLQKYRQSRKSVSNFGKNSKIHQQARLFTKTAQGKEQKRLSLWIKSVYLPVKSTKAPKVYLRISYGNLTAKTQVMFNSRVSQSPICSSDSQKFRNSSFCRRKPFLAIWEASFCGLKFLISNLGVIRLIL